MNKPAQGGLIQDPDPRAQIVNPDAFEMAPSIEEASRKLAAAIPDPVKVKDMLCSMYMAIWRADHSRSSPGARWSGKESAENLRERINGR